jgi:hypothetical protein
MAPSTTTLLHKLIILVRLTKRPTDPLVSSESCVTWMESSPHYLGMLAGRNTTEQKPRVES